MDNQSTQAVDNTQTQASDVTATVQAPASAQTTAPAADTFSWKSNLGADLANSPLLQKFSDDKSGLSEAFKSHSNLEQLLGNEKIPIPKGENDVEGWKRFNKAMGIPDKSTQYALQDVKLPDSMKGITFSKEKFADTVHSFKLTPGQAQGLWKAYTEMTLESYNNAVKDHQTKVTESINKLRGEWGDAYDTNIEIGQMVINKFSADQEMNDYLTSVLSSDPRGSKFLAQVGRNFQENQIGEFKYKNFSLTPDEANSERAEILGNPKHPYNNEKAAPEERNAAIDRVNKLIEIGLKARQG